MRRMLAVIAVAALILVAGVHKADAHVGFSIGIGVPGVYVGPPVVYSAPAYYYPPAYYGGYYGPAYYAPYYGYGYGYGYAPYYGGSVFFHSGHWGGHRRHWGGGWHGGRHWR